MADNKIFNDIQTKEPITKGLSGDKKYCVEIADGQRMLLRVTDIDEYDRKKGEYDMMSRAYELGVLTPKPVEFGLCDDGKSVYSLSGWIEGEDGETALPKMSSAEQYLIGIKTGEMLRKVHTLSAQENAEPWSVRFRNKIKDRDDAYNAHNLKSEHYELIIKYLHENAGLLDSRPQAFIHGDFWIGNLMINLSGDVGIIDFNYYNLGYGDPWYELGDNVMLLDAKGESYFFTGQLRGYFNGEPPEEFFKMLMYYYAYNALATICDVTEGHDSADCLKRLENILRWFADFKNIMPSWYLKDFYVQYIDGIPYKLKAPFDFSFLSKYGKVVKIFDNQDSGNICFCTTNGENKYFVKFAGAPTERACVSVEEAVINLKRTVPIYKDLAHQNLVKFIDAEEIGGGYAVIFEWVDAECMHPMYPLSREKFLEMTLDTRCQVFEDILTFHAYVAKQGYVAIDFYDGSIMYDFTNNKTVICDIDFYSKSPYINDMGRMWGSSRFMSPEEFELGAVIDEITNVYAMGATAFALFGDEKDRRIEKWRLSKELFDVAKKAVRDERSERQQSIEQFIEEWREAKT